MSNIVGKVKERFQSRSQRRASEPMQVDADEPLPTSRVAEKYSTSNINTMPSNSLRDPLPAGVNGSTISVSHSEQPFPYTSPGLLMELVPDRLSSRKNMSRPTTSSSSKSKGHRHTASQGTTTSTTSMAGGIPDRRSSRRPVSSSAKSLGLLAGGNENPNSDIPRISQEKPRGRVTGHRTSRSIDVAPNDPSPLIPRYGTELASSSRNPVPSTAFMPTTDLPKHMLLPPNSKLGSSERTFVDTTWRPAVTSETIVHNRTEVIQEAVTRDVHVHHHHTYVQPVKVVEILPARHFRLDEKTGAKIEIPAPANWVMPEHLQPKSPDLGAIQPTQRHYLVNEQHPNGVLEQEPPHQITQHPPQTNTT